MNQGRNLVMRRFGGLDDPAALTLIAGIILGMIILKSWILALALSVFVVVLGVAAHSILAIWICLLAVMFFVANYFSPPITTLSFWGLFALFTFSFWWHSLRAGRAVIFGDRFVWLSMLAWFFWGVIAALFSPDLLLSLKEVARYGLLLLMIFTFMQWISDEDSLRGILKVLWIILILYAVLMIAKIILQENQAGQLLGNYWHSEAESANIFAAFLPVFGSVVKYQRGPSWMKGLVILLFFSVIVLSHSASALLAAGVGMLTLVFFNSPPSARRIMGWIFLASTGGVILALLYIGGFGEKILYQLSGRDRIWAAAFQAILSHPFLGIGPGRWHAWFSTNYMSADFIFDDLRGNLFVLNPSTLLGQAHNLFLTKAAEMGIPSLIFLVCIFGTWLVKALSVSRMPLEGWRHDLVRGCLASFIGLTCFCLFENGPIIGVAREGEVLLITLILAIPLVAERWLKKSWEGSE